MRYLDGTVEEVQQQATFLENNDIFVSHKLGVCGVGSDAYGRVLKLFWLYKVPGWTRYKEDLVKYHICSEDDIRPFLEK